MTLVGSTVQQFTAQLQATWQLQTEKLPQKCEQLLPFVLNLAEVGLSLPSSEQPQLDCPL